MIVVMISHAHQRVVLHALVVFALFKCTKLLFVALYIYYVIVHDICVMFVKACLCVFMDLSIIVNTLPKMIP